MMSLALVRRSSIAVAIGLAMLVQAVNAGTINVDFNRAGITYVGTAMAPDSGTFWNGTNGGSGGFTLSNMTDSTGVVGVADLTVGAYFSNFNADAGTNPPVVPFDLMRDYIYKRNTETINPITTTLTFNELADGRYKLYLYAAGDTPGQGGNFSLDAANQVVGGVSAGSTTAAHRDIYNGGLGVNYTVLDAMTNAGSILINWSRLDGQNFGGLNGIQIQQVPEPGTFAFAVLAMGCVWCRRSR